MLETNYDLEGLLLLFWHFVLFVQMLTDENDKLPSLMSIVPFRKHLRIWSLNWKKKNRIYWKIVWQILNGFWLCVLDSEIWKFLMNWRINRLSIVEIESSAIPGPFFQRKIFWKQRRYFGSGQNGGRWFIVFELEIIHAFFIVKSAFTCLLHIIETVHEGSLESEMN